MAIRDKDGNIIHNRRVNKQIKKKKEISSVGKDCRWIGDNYRLYEGKITKETGKEYIVIGNKRIDEDKPPKILTVSKTKRIYIGK